MSIAKPRQKTGQKLAVIEGGRIEAARESESRYQILFDQASDAIITVASEGRIEEANQACEELTSFLKNELVGQNISVLSPDPKIHRIPERSRPLSKELFKTAGTYEDIVIVGKDGYIHMVEVSVRVIKKADGDFALALFRDVTEKKRMERELITKHAELREAYFQLEKKNAELHAMQDTLVQAGKMAALGELAAGIAHELNQPLQGIRGYAQELQTLVTNPSSEVDSSMKEIISNVDKMHSIIDYLRTFTRKSVEKHEMTDVHTAIDEALKMLSRQFASRGIKVDKSYGKDVPNIYANPLQLEQVFINLATNARDAIETTGRGGGNIRIRTRSSGQFIEVLFQDDGVGMSERTKAKAFNPFFTTKEVGKGMGLGLSLSYGVISKIQGSIVVESELGKGAAFLVRLPKDFREIG
ncbi:PAS domain S-box protein [bacterium]|nr:PAS domain S-box protein [bacterium]